MRSNKSTKISIGLYKGSIVIIGQDKGWKQDDPKTLVKNKIHALVVVQVYMNGGKAIHIVPASLKAGTNKIRPDFL